MIRRLDRGAGDGPARPIRFSPAAYDAILTHARTGAPEEVCGVLGGTRGFVSDGSGGTAGDDRADRTAVGDDRADDTDGTDPTDPTDDTGGTAGSDDTGGSDGTAGTAAGASSSVVRSVHRTANVAERPRTEYRIDPAEQYDAMREIEAQGDEIVGFYHSHPTGPPHPSATDRERATWNGYSYVIVTLNGDEPSVGSWRWTGDGFEPETVVVE